MTAIYKITNQLNGKPYVGQTRQPLEKRFLQHSKARTPLGNAMRQCGLENFTIEVIETCETQTQANERERFWIKVLKCKIPNGYNQRDGGSLSIKPRVIDSNGTETINERINRLRRAKKMTQVDFGKIIGLSQKAVSMMEEAGGTVTERNFNTICEKFSVNPKWLRFGVGEMFLADSVDTYIDKVVAEKKLTEEDRALIETMLELPPAARNAFRRICSKTCSQCSRSTNRTGTR